MKRNRGLKWRLWQVCGFFLLFLPLGAQTPDVNYDVLLVRLEEGLNQGNPRAFREIAGMYDFLPSHNKKDAFGLVTDFLFLEKPEWENPSDLSSKKLFGFLNDTSDKLRYSPILRSFYTRPIESFTAEAKVEKAKPLSTKDKALALKRYKSVVEMSASAPVKVFVEYQLQRIADLGTEESYRYLLGMLEGKGVPENVYKQEFFRKTLCQAISTYRISESLERLLIEVENGNLSPKDASVPLSFLTNRLFLDPQIKDLISRYRLEYEKAGSLQSMRMEGFRDWVDAEPDYFKDEADYLAFVLAKVGKQPFLRENALDLLLDTGDSKALFYAAAVLFGYSGDNFFNTRRMVQLFKERVDSKIIVKNGGGEWVSLDDLSNKQDRTFYFNLAVYWASNYEIYEYDSEKGYYFNTKIKDENEETASRLFKKLTSSNDLVAMSSYKSLSKYPSELIAVLEEKYQPVLRRANPILPDFRFGFLYALSELNRYCEEEGFETVVNPPAIGTMEKLKMNPPFEERIELEKRLFEQLKLNDLTGLEIEALIHSKNVEFNRSVSRILDRKYSLFLSQIAGDNNELRFYLKKAGLFRSIGIGGNCNKYIDKVKEEGRVPLRRIKKLAASEYDEHIREVLSEWNTEPGEIEIPDRIPLEKFLARPELYDSRDLMQIEEPTDKNYKQVFKALTGFKEPRGGRMLSEYLGINLKEGMLPDLIKLLDSGKVLFQEGSTKRTLTDDAVLMLESLFNHSFRQSDDEALRETAERWNAFSKKHPDFSTWEQQLFLLRASEVIHQKELTARDLNILIESEFYADHLSKDIIDALPRLKKESEIRKLKWRNSLNPKDHLDGFSSLEFPLKYLEQIVGYFDQANPDVLIRFIEDKLKGSNPEEMGKIWNRVLAKHPALLKRLLEDSFNEAGIQGGLNAYLNQSGPISSFEEKRLLKHLFLLESKGMTLAEEINFAKTFTRDEELAYTLQQFRLEQAVPDELEQIFPFVDDLVDYDESSRLRFFMVAFGLPEHLVDTEDERIDWEKGLERGIPVFLMDVLEKTGNPIKDKSGKPDFDKINFLLEFDITAPFSGTETKEVARYSITAIRLLELLFPEAGYPQVEPGDVVQLRATALFWKNYLKANNSLTNDRSGVSFGSI